VTAESRPSPESSWRDPEIDWRRARILALGIDVGSVSAKAAVLADGRILAYGLRPTGADSAASAAAARRLVLAAAGGMPEERLSGCVATGYGRVNVPFAQRTVTEIACHARGAHFIYGPEVRTVLDVGGQDIKAIHCDEKGRVVNFLMNDKCAAGTGRAMEAMAGLLGLPVAEAGERSLAFGGAEPEAVASTCVVYAKSEALGLMRRGRTREQVLAAYCRATAERIRALLERIGVRPAFAVTGGMAKNRGVMERLEKGIGLARLEARWDPQIAGAAGAALFAHALCEKALRK
jgi:bzd-type benzoyl-CoA reductase Q subunit